jgi:NADPH:quinone reductase-like Zn-dependent oxidoreductase
MLFTRSGLRAGDTVLIQGAGGGVATALIALARAGGFRVLVTSRDEQRGHRALELGAHEVFASGARLPGRVDAVMDTVGKATWSHSVRSLRPGGTLVTTGVTSGDDLQNPELTRIFFLQLSVVGSTMGTRAEFRALIDLLDVTGVRPMIDSTLPMAEAPTGFRRMVDGDVFGKIVFTI